MTCPHPRQKSEIMNDPLAIGSRPGLAGAGTQKYCIPPYWTPDQVRGLGESLTPAQVRGVNLWFPARLGRSRDLGRRCAVSKDPGSSPGTGEGFYPGSSPGTGEGFDPGSSPGSFVLFSGVLVLFNFHPIQNCESMKP